MDLLALISLFFACTENLLSDWAMTPKISTSLQLGIIPIGEQRSRLPLFLIVNPLHLLGLQDIQFVYSSNVDNN